MSDKSHWVYILRNKDKTKNNTYCGYTNNPGKRLKQHNGELKGGAKTTNGKQWEYMLLITGFVSINSALSFEWKLKHPDGKKIKNSKYCGPDGRIKGLNEVLKFNNEKLIIHVEEEFKFNYNNENIEIKNIGF